MRISRADTDLWRAREAQESRRLNPTGSSPFVDHRFDLGTRKSATSRKGRASRTDAINATPPMGDVLEQTTGNIAVLRHLIDHVLPTLPMPQEVRQCACSLFAEDMDHHLRVLDATEHDGKEQDTDGKLEQSERAVAVPQS